MKNIPWKRVILDIVLIFTPELFRIINAWIDKKKEETKE